MNFTASASKPGAETGAKRQLEKAAWRCEACWLEPSDQ